MITRALLSVSDKTGIVEFAQALQKHGVELLSTGGTARALREAGLTVVDVSEHTGHKEVFDGRVKTLHPMIHGGILYRRGHDQDEATAREEGIGPIDLVCVNLYPFEKVAADRDRSLDDLIENIDIGGPSMLRSAAKNHAHVTVLTDPADYDLVVDALDDGGPDKTTRQRLALKAFARTAAYDAAISTTLAGRLADDKDPLPPSLSLSYAASEPLRYGENPHQAARVYPAPAAALPLAGTAPLQGKALSYNNLLDADAAVFALRAIATGQDLAPFAAVVIKHLTPCGAAFGPSLLDAFERAKAGDSKSAFGGIVALSHPCDEPTAQALGEMFLEVVIAPGFSDEARAVLAKKKNLRVLALPGLLGAPEEAFTARTVYGGLLVQQADRPFLGLRDRGQVVTERAPTEDEWNALDFAFRTVVAVKSNAITLAHPGMLIAAGGGQTSRVDAVELAVKKALEHHHNPKGAALGSDAFFPFADGVVAAAEAGVRAVAQPGGSKRDQEVIDACNRLGLAMVFTGERHFRH